MLWSVDYRMALNCVTNSENFVGPEILDTGTKNPVITLCAVDPYRT